MDDVYNMAHLNPVEEPSHTEQVLKSEVTKTTKLFQNWCRDEMFPEDELVPKLVTGRMIPELVAGVSRIWLQTRQQTN